MRRILLLLCLFPWAALPCRAGDDEAKTNTLTPKEIAAGWILLFDGETTFGWTGDGWKVDKGELVSPGKKVPLQSTCEFVDFELEFECISQGRAGGFLGFGKSSENESRLLAVDLPGNDPGWQKVRLTVVGRQAAGTIKSLQETRPSASLKADIRERPSIAVPLVFGGTLRLRSIKLRPLHTNPIFNGKDLTGWREFPGKKSRFTVTDQGVLNVKDGPGDLQTVGKYQNFILQLECISLGKHLNSGVFFRCRANEYQNGYEAQIRNQFTAEPAQQYVIEDYDPKTHELVGKKTIQSTAVDYGTGAIYRRVPARKQMSKDGKWFGMTILADGNHLATWVNGVQVVDWRDNRPRSDNARKGCKLDAGHLSIQGHDPTTNLSFRNLRIVELPE
jgi:hypothetical protein